MTGPAVSVALPVRNAQPYLAESLASVRSQTFADFELVIVDDASTDGSTEVLREAARADPRVRLVERSRPAGGVEVFNEVVGLCTAPLIARMDADDVCRPCRFELQVEAMRADPEVVLAGTLADGIDARGRATRPRDRWRLVRCDASPFPHGSAMYRRDAFERAGGYRPEAGPSADLDLFVRLGEIGKVVVLPDALYRYRYHLSSSTMTVVDVGRSRAAHRLWAGERPPGPGELRASGALSATPAGLAALARSVWGSVSPGSLRALLRAAIRARDLAAVAWIGNGGVREWRFE